MAEYFWHPYPDRGDPVYMGCRGVWQRGDLSFNREAIRSFEAYGGVIDIKANMPGAHL